MERNSEAVVGGGIPDYCLEEALSSIIRRRDSGVFFGESNEEHYPVEAFRGCLSTAAPPQGLFTIMENIVTLGRQNEKITDSIAFQRRTATYQSPPQRSILFLPKSWFIYLVLVDILRRDLRFPFHS